MSGDFIRREENTMFVISTAISANIIRRLAAMLSFSPVQRTLTAVRALQDNEFGPVSQKHVHSVNVPAVCGLNMALTNVVA